MATLLDCTHLAHFMQAAFWAAELPFRLGNGVDGDISAGLSSRSSAWLFCSLRPHEVEKETYLIKLWPHLCHPSPLKRQLQLKLVLDSSFLSLPHTHTHTPLTRRTLLTVLACKWCRYCSGFLLRAAPFRAHTTRVGALSVIHGVKLTPQIVSASQCVLGCHGLPSYSTPAEVWDHG